MPTPTNRPPSTVFAHELTTSDTDDPRVLSEAATEDYSLHVAPLSWRVGRGSLTMAWWAMVSAMFFIIVAATVAQVVGTVDALIGLALSVASYGVINAVISRYASRTGLTVALFSRALFGHLGASLAALIFAATAVYYAVFEGSVVAVALHQLVGGHMWIWYLVVVAYSIPLVFGGVQRWLDRLNGVLLPFYWLGLIAAVVWTVIRFGYNANWLTYQPTSAPSLGGPGWLFAFATYMGVWILMMYTWDFARLARPQDAKYHARVSFGPVFYLLAFGFNGLVGIFLSQAIPHSGSLSEAGVVVSLINLMGVAGLVLVWVSQTRINTANYYLASANAESFFTRALHLRLPRRVWAVIVGAVVYVLMLTDVFSYLLQALTLQGVLVVGWVAIALTHIVLDHLSGRSPEDVEFRPGRVPRFSAPGLLAWAASAVVGIVLTESPWSGAATWSPLITAAIAASAYALLRTTTGRSSASLVRGDDPRHEVEDTWTTRVLCEHCGKSYIAHEMDRDPSSAALTPVCADCGSSDRRFLRAARAGSGIT